MIRYFLLRFILPLALFLIIRAILKSVFGSSRTAVAPQPASTPSSEPPSSGELKKDPVCGTYVSAATALTREVKGSTLYFCSKACRDKYKV